MNRILIFHHYSYFGGAGKSLVDIINSIDKTKNEVFVYTRSESEEIINILNKLSVKVIKGGIHPQIFDFYSGNERNLLDIRNLRNIWRIYKSSKEIKGIVKNINPHIVVINSFTLCWIGETLKNFKDIKKVCFYRETLGKEHLGIRNAYIKRCLNRYFDKVAYISEYDMKCIGNFDKGTIITDKVEIIEKNFDKYEAMEELGLDNSKKYILFLGGISKLKGTHVILQSLSKLPLEYHLIIMQSNGFNMNSSFKNKLRRIFGNDYEYYWHKYFQNNKLSDRVHFFSTVIDIKKFYAVSDVVVFCSTKQHQARPLYESGIYERPFIITDFECTKEFAINGYNCLTFRENDYNDLKNKILLIDEDPKLKMEIVKNNRMLTIEKHNVNNLTKELNDFFRNI